MPAKDAFTATRRLYDLLGASPTATPKAIRSCYRKMVRKWHPDFFLQGSPEQAHAAEKFRELTAAYRRIKHAPLRYVSKSESRGRSTSSDTRGQGTTPASAETARPRRATVRAKVESAALSSMAATPGMGRKLLWIHSFLVIVNALIPVVGIYLAEGRPEKRWGLLCFFVVGLAVHASELWEELKGSHASQDDSPLRSALALLSGAFFAIYPLLILLFLIQALSSLGYLAIGPALGLMTWLLIKLHLRNTQP
jgi:hypothetical protein